MCVCVCVCARVQNALSSRCSGLTFSGAEICSVCTEAGMFAIRARRKVHYVSSFLY